MMRLVVMVLCLAVAGCAGWMEKRYENLDEQVSLWMESREYGKALSALKAVPPSLPDYGHYAELLTAVAARAQAYEESLIQRSREAIENNRWAEAIELLQFGIEQLPDSLPLRDAMARLQAEQQAAVEEQEKILLHARGAYWVNALPALRQIATIMGNDGAAQAQFEEAKAEAAAIAGRLATLGRDAWAREEPEAALGYLALAADLSEDAVVRQQYRDYLQALFEQAVQLSEALQARKELEVQQLAEKERAYRLWSSRFDAALKRNDIPGAKAELSRLQQVDGHNRAIAVKRSRLEKAMAREVERLYSEGVVHYRSERFQQALDRWRQALAIDPEHEEAQAGVVRVERVLQKIHQLQKELEGQ